VNTPTSFYWHDYETWGATPRLDRAAQFAGIRTDLDFNVIGRPLMIYAQPADDFLPHPEACFVTGLTPQECREKGVPEAEFFKVIHEELARPGTCALGYNTLRFDDEVTRYGFYRNFIDPYAREWQNGNSRWDLIDVVRLTRALRPEGIEWPTREDGVTSFKLEHLTTANGIAHEGAHDALSDVHATIALARLIKEKQPKLFDYAFSNRDKRALARMLDVRAKRPLLHVSGKYPAALGHIAAVVPLALHPTNKNEVIVYDLRVDPEPLLTLDADAIRERMFTRSEDLPEGEVRIPLKTIRLNRAPVVVPMSTLTDAARVEWQLDAEAEARHLLTLQQATGLEHKLAQVFGQRDFEPVTDPDLDLYGGFLSDADRRLCDQVHRAAPDELARLHPPFEAAKLHELLFRYRARNWPQTLTAAEKSRWEEYRRERVMDPALGISLPDYRRKLSQLAIDPGLNDEQRALVGALIDWPAEIGL